jgi:hypothetical protein
MLNRAIGKDQSRIVEQQTLAVAFAHDLIKSGITHRNQRLRQIVPAKDSNARNVVERRGHPVSPNISARR